VLFFFFCGGAVVRVSTILQRVSSFWLDPPSGSLGIAVGLALGGVVTRPGLQTPDFGQDPCIATRPLKTRTGLDLSITRGGGQNPNPIVLLFRLWNPPSGAAPIRILFPPFVMERSTPVRVFNALTFGRRPKVRQGSRPTSGGRRPLMGYFILEGILYWGGG